MLPLSAVPSGGAGARNWLPDSSSQVWRYVEQVGSVRLTDAGDLDQSEAVKIPVPFDVPLCIAVEERPDREVEAKFV